MPRNIKGGGKAKKGANKTVNAKHETPFVTEDGMMYGKIIKNQGGHFDVICTDNVQYIGKMRGKLKKKMRIAVGDIVLVSCRLFATNQNTCDILHRYTYDEAKGLLAQGDIKFELNKQEEDTGIRFGDELNEISDYESDPLEAEGSDADEDTLTAPKQIMLEPPKKTGRDKQSRANFRDAKTSRLENLTHEEQ